jgi:phytoene synthase
VRLYWPAGLRPAFDALLDIDDALAAIVERSTEPALAAIKLAWWREQLEELDDGVIPAEPRLRAAAAKLLSRGVRGAHLAELTEGWAALLDEQPDTKRIAEGGARLFGVAARLLGASNPMIEPAGRLYGYANAARRGLMTIEAATGELQRLSAHRFPKKLRPLTSLAALAARDARRPPPFEPEATPGRSWTLIRHRLNGKV